MKNNKIIIKTKDKNYNILIGANLIKNLHNILKLNSLNSINNLVIFDSNIPKKIIKLLKNKFNKRSLFYKFYSSEKNKNQESVNKILNLMLKHNFTRNDCLIAIGGGIVGDTSAFAASIFKRGIKFINIPTTLLAQVDSSIGGKTGINSKYGKNLIGSFSQPNLVISDVNLLKSLPKREIICGYGEILKHSIISNKKFFRYLLNNFNKIINLQKPFINKAIYESCLIKKRIVEKDEKEKNLRKLLNLGHTFAHAYEATCGYSKKLNHGEAVLLGIKSASEFSYLKKLLSFKDHLMINNHIRKVNKSLELKNFFKKKDKKKILKFMYNDKKNNNRKINLILIKKIGKVNHDNFFNYSEINKFIDFQFNKI